MRRRRSPNTDPTNLTFDRVFHRVGLGCRRDGDPETLDAESLGREFERVAAEFNVVPPPGNTATKGHAFTVALLRRAGEICRALAALPIEDIRGH